jgi:hypothetical protein
MKRTYDIYKDGSPYILDIHSKKDAERLYKIIWKTFKPRVLKLFVNETKTSLLLDNNK